MADEVGFLELACLMKVTPNTVLEKFGSAINASIFDASNIAGTMKQEGLIDFTAYYPGPNEMVVTENGKRLLSEADAKASEPFDKLDETILNQLSGGKKVPLDLQNNLNLRPKDLALRLYKLFKQNFLIYELRSGNVDIMLTETGFLKASATHASTKQTQPQPPRQQQAQVQQQSDTHSEQTQAAAPPPQSQQESEQNISAVLAKIHAKRKGSRMAMYVAVAVVIAAAVLYLLYYRGVI